MGGHLIGLCTTTDKYSPITSGHLSGHLITSGHLSGHLITSGHLSGLHVPLVSLCLRLVVISMTVVGH